MRPLYEIAIEYKSLFNELLESDEITAEQLQLLDQQADNFEQKIINLSALIRNLEIEYESIHNAINAMDKRKNALDKKIESLKKYAISNMELCNIQAVKSPLFDVKLKKNPARVSIIEESLIPKEYIRQVVVDKVDKKDIMEKLKLNIPVPGATLENGMRLEIR